jgi:signal transduction histidine kinase
MSRRKYTALAVQGRDWLLRWRWVLVALSVLVFIAFEVREHWGEGLFYTNLSFLREALLFGVVGPLAMGILLTFLAATRSERLRAFERLSVQHELARQLADLRDWEELATFVTRFPQKLAPVSGVSLFVNDHQAGDFCFVSDWWAAGVQESAASPWLHTPGSCAACLQAQTATAANLLSCQCLTPASLADYSNRYSLSLVHGAQPVAVLYLYFPAGLALTAEQIELLHEAAAPLAMAIHSALPVRSAGLQTEAVEAERQRIARDLHDTLGQSLGFLHLKLDQLATDGALNEIAEIRQELERMRDVANEAYTQVRDTLSDLKPPEGMALAAALRKRAQSVGERAHFQIQFRSHGQPQNLSPDVQRHILYLVREVLANVEKHAQARLVEIDLDWTADALNLVLTDDGQGFEPHKLTPNGHFGLEIMRERAREIDGQLNIHSSPNAGTKVSLALPLDSASAPGQRESL